MNLFEHFFPFSSFFSEEIALVHHEEMFKYVQQFIIIMHIKRTLWSRLSVYSDWYEFFTGFYIKCGDVLRVRAVRQQNKKSLNTFQYVLGRKQIDSKCELFLYELRF